MRSNLALAAAIVVSASLTGSLAQAKEKGPCGKIKEACEGAGFAKGQAKEGTGLWVDCIDPIMRGEDQPKTATKPLPTVDAADVKACRDKNPKFGQRKANK